MTRVMRWLIAGAVLASPSLSWSQPDGRSSDAARELGALLEQHHRDAIAVADPSEPDRFVAALYLPGSQLLVISAKYSVPVLMKEQIIQGKDRDVYRDLQAAGELADRFFVQDLGVDGIHNGNSAKPSDITWRNGAIRTVYNTDWASQDISEVEYRRRFAADTAQYAQLLEVLKNAVAATTQ